jgi:isocitrate/isopropylmalate dehydrogenase
MMIDHLGHAAATAEVVSAVRESLRDGTRLTRDLRGHTTTTEMATAVLDRIGN